MDQLSAKQLTGLVILRVLIGWHFLYEGLTKIWDPFWTSEGYLKSSEWILSGFFDFLVETPGRLATVDLLNEWGLVAIGIALIAGFLSRPASYAGMVLLLFYYTAHPPLIGFESPTPVEGSYLVVNKNLIEAAAMFVLALFPTGHIIGLDRFLLRKN